MGGTGSHSKSRIVRAQRRVRYNPVVNVNRAAAQDCTRIGGACLGPRKSVNITNPGMRTGKFIMSFPEPQCEAVFLARPQRFLAHMAFPDGSDGIVYCANPGSFNGCLQAGSAALLWDSQDPARKRRYTWRAIKLNDVWIGTDTHLANRLVEQLLCQQLLPCLRGYEIIAREQLVRRGLRVDFLLKDKGTCFLEVKSATVVEKGIARFPDSITPRGLKHLQGLTRKVKEGHRAVLLFLVQRNDAKSFSLSSHYPAYAYNRAFKKALAAGVEVFACAVEVRVGGSCRHPLVSWRGKPARTPGGGYPRRTSLPRSQRIQN